MADEKKQPAAEPIQVKEPAKKEAGKQESGAADIDKVLSRLEQMGVKTEQDLAGIHAASQQAGRLANLLGEANKRIESLERDQATRAKRPADEPHYGESQPIDLRREIRNVMREFYTEDVVKPQREATEKYYRDLEFVESSEHYALVEERWKKHVANPKTQARLGRGETDLRGEFQRVVMDEYRDLALQARDALKAVREGTSSKTKPPHVEGGPSRSPARTTDEDDRAERIDKTKKEWKGTDDDVDKMLDILLPKGDPIMRVPR